MRFFRRQKPQPVKHTIPVSRPATAREWLEIDHPLPRGIKQWILDNQWPLEKITYLSISTPPKVKPKKEGSPFNPWTEYEPGEIHNVTAAFTGGDMGHQLFNWNGEKVKV